MPDKNEDGNCLLMTICIFCLVGGGILLLGKIGKELSNSYKKDSGSFIAIMLVIGVIALIVVRVRNSK